MSNDDSDLAQVHRLLTALHDNMAQTTNLIEKMERQRPARSVAGPRERALRRELSEAHGHVNRIYERFPETRP
ncbi:hypothetical protein BH09ACT8_BH09ACT8_60900 [soil metagenome]